MRGSVWIPSPKRRYRPSEEAQCPPAQSAHSIRLSPIPWSSSSPPYGVPPPRRTRWVRHAILWALFLLTVTSVAFPFVALGFGVAWLIALAWPVRHQDVNRQVVTDLGTVDAEFAIGFEMRIIWMARWQAAVILGTRAWQSDELMGSLGKIDLAAALDDLTTRALHLLKFTSTALPTPSRSQPELRRQWSLEQDRVAAIKEELVEQVAALIVYREHLELISDLLDQRDQMAVYSERAAAFDDALPRSTDGPSLLDAAYEQRELHGNLASQLQYLGKLTEGSESGPRLPIQQPASEI